MHVTLTNAETAIAAAVKKAQSLKTHMCIAVVDSGANLKAFHRMDDAWVGSIDIAIKKAKTAVYFGMPTGQIGKLSQPGAPGLPPSKWSEPMYGFRPLEDGKCRRKDTSQKRSLPSCAKSKFWFRRGNQLPTRCARLA